MIKQVPISHALLSSYVNDTVKCSISYQVISTGISLTLDKRAAFSLMQDSLFVKSPSISCGHHGKRYESFSPTKVDI